MINPNPIAFTVFGYPIMWYGVLISLGVVLGVVLAMHVAPRYGWMADDIVDAALIGVPLAIIGARLYFVAFYDLAQYLQDPIRIIRIRDGGLAIYGGLLGGLLGAVIYGRWKKKSIRELFDIIVPSFALGQAIGRWGNFFNQEAFGAQITDPRLMWFPFAVLIEETKTIHYATFFYESLWCVLILLFLVTQRKRFKHSGDVFLTYALLYSFERMLIEGLRTDSLMLGPFRVSQLLSAAVFVGVGAFLLIRWQRERLHPPTITNKLHPLYAADDTHDEPATAVEDEGETQEADVDVEPHSANDEA